MNSQDIFCPNLDCRARGHVGKGNIGVHIGVHNEGEPRYICHECRETFTATKGTIFYRLRREAKTVMTVITLLAYGCPPKAVVKAFGFHERTVKSWCRRLAGSRPSGEAGLQSTCWSGSLSGAKLHG